MTSPHDDDELLERYRRASRDEGVAPSPQTREAILAEGRRIAALRSQLPASAGRDRQRSTVRRRRLFAAAASVAIAVVAALVVLPQVWESPRGGVMSKMASARKRTTASDESSPSAAMLGSAYSPGIAPKLSSVPAQSLAKAPAESLAKTPAASSAEAPVANYIPPPASPAAAARAETSQAPGDGSLLSAVAVGDDARVAELLAQGADTHGADLRGRTPLMLAVMQRRLDMVRLLLAHGAAPNVPDRAGETPLQWARRHDAADMVAALEAAGAR